MEEKNEPKSTSSIQKWIYLSPGITILIGVLIQIAGFFGKFLQTVFFVAGYAKLW